MKKDGIPLPSALSGEISERLIRLDRSLVFLVTGVLAELTDEWQFEQTGTLTVEDAREALNDMLWCFMKGCEVTPIGTISMFGALTPPDKWLVCDGQEINRADYPELFAAIGETWGDGDGSLTFNLPDFGDFSPMGLGGIVNTVGGSYGEQWHTLTTDEMPLHGHGVTDNGHTHNAKWATSGAPGSGAGTWQNSAGYSNSASQIQTATTGITIQSAGNSAQHNNVHPVKGVPFIIFAGR